MSQDPCSSDFFCDFFFEVAMLARGDLDADSTLNPQNLPSRAAYSCRGLAKWLQHLGCIWQLIMHGDILPY